MKAFQVGVWSLWSIWLCGLALFCLSLYATQCFLPSLKDQIMRPKLSKRGAGVLEPPKIIIFSAPRPFTGSVGARQSLAVRSWLALTPQIAVVLFSKDPSVVSFAGAFDSRVLVEPNIDFTFLGTPFFHSMMARSRSFSSDISVLVDPETILLPDFISTMNYAYKLDHDWLLVASSRNVSDFPFYLDEDGKHWQRENGKLMTTQEGVHNSWVVSEALSSELRFVFDASWTISSFYLVDQEHQTDWNVGGSSASNFERSWEYAGNSHIGALYGSLSYLEVNYRSLVKLLKCDGQYIFVNTTENIVCPLVYQSAGRLWKGRIVRFGWKKNTLAWVEGVKSLGQLSDCSQMVPTKHTKPLDLPFSLETLLSFNADKNNTILLTAAGYSYKDMLMSWVCRLRQLQVTNFIICALDQEIYEFAVLQGLPVFRDPLAPSEISFSDCHFGTKCFQKVTKVKSRLVLKILMMAQSDEFNKTGPINLPRRLNSGFYFARSDGSTIDAMKKVVTHAATSDLSEQPSFYDTLCGEGGSNRVGDDRCLEPETNLSVHFLDRDLFPNGAYLDLWQRKKVRAACVKQGCFVLHNNWISGRLKKLERQFYQAYGNMILVQGCVSTIPN
ncbi:beta-arabinofuranosyltransferase RAY1 [Prunus yedoensis var. nudiflora]|uniref:Beta-arabinofuranosyltransferase RAY1 n=1 Tax=Prunus yedoensis var. nudiflora TaxID=2094558 RepID=A0A314Y6J0_PRUYE|nr:beta-arabinofuranosyltransferase RAY1 [Prunus yedoensis var. nudiflora]